MSVLKRKPNINQPRRLYTSPRRDRTERINTYKKRINRGRYVVAAGIFQMDAKQKIKKK